LFLGLDSSVMVVLVGEEDYGPLMMVRS
jgi:hypothetical protein